MAKTILIQTKQGPSTVPTVWQGANLSVHRPASLKTPGGLSKLPCHWTITHTALGFACCLSFDGPKARAVELAKLWDAEFSAIKKPSDARQWRFVRSWARDCQLAQMGTAELEGPILPDHPTEQDVAQAMARALSGV